MALIRVERVSWTERVFWLALVTAAIGLVVFRPPPEEVARRYVDALNREDVDAALGLVTTDFVIRPLLGGYYYRAEAARNVLEWRAVLNERWQILDSTYDSASETVRLRLVVGNDAWRLLRPPFDLEALLAMRGSRVLSERFARGADAELRESLAPFLRWARAERSVELERVWSASEGPVQSRERARSLFQLLREWRGAEGTVAGDPAPGRQ